MRDYILIPTITLFLGTAAITQAQEGKPGETLPKPKSTGTPLLYEGPPCTKGCNGIKVLNVEQTKPVRVLIPREVTTTVKRPTLAVDYYKKKCVITEFELKPVKVVRKVPCTIMKPCKVVDPHTGHCSTVMKPFTEVKLREETVFQSVPVKREFEIKVPYLKEVEEEVPQRNVLLEYRTEMQSKTFIVPAPTTVLPDRYYITPQPHHPHHHEVVPQHHHHHHRRGLFRR